MAKAESKPKPKPKPKPAKEFELDLLTMYLASAVAGAHSIGLRLSPERSGSRKGFLSLDPNHCGLNDWGDRTWCTRMAVRIIEVKSTRMRTLDPSGHHRILHRLTSKTFAHESANLIEYPKLGLWYLVYQRKDAGSWVVPLFDAAALAADPAGTIAMRYGVPMREVVERGDVEEMKLEADVVRAALEGLESTRGVKNLADVRAALAELDAAIAKAES